MQRIWAILLLALMPVSAAAQSNGQLQQLNDVLRLPEVIDIMRREGLQQTEEMAEGMPGGKLEEWAEITAAIYDADRMEASIMAGMAGALGSDDDVGGIIGFYQADLGAQIINLELTAREAFMDPAIEEASNEFAAMLPSENAERYELLQTFIETNNLLESNVVGALNSNFAFFQGMVEGGGMQQAPSEEDMLREVWSQEGEIRSSTTEWLNSYLSLAYQPLTDEELKEYIAFSETDDGDMLNTILFAGFDAMFIEISRALGFAFARMNSGEDL